MKATRIAAGAAALLIGAAVLTGLSGAAKPAHAVAARRAADPPHSPPTIPVPTANDQWTNCGPWHQIGSTGIYWTWHRQRNASDGNYEVSWYFYNGYQEKADITYQILDSANESVANQEEHVRPGDKVGGEGSGDWGYSKHANRMGIRITHLNVGDTVVVGK